MLNFSKLPNLINQEGCSYSKQIDFLQKISSQIKCFRQSSNIILQKIHATVREASKIYQNFDARNILTGQNSRFWPKYCCLQTINCKNAS